MSSRYPRSGSPTGGGRNPARSSTGALGYSAYDGPSSSGPPSSYSRHRDVVASPRSSGERVIPISTERYVNGERVSTTGPSRYDAYDSRPRRTTLDAIDSLDSVIAVLYGAEYHRKLLWAEVSKGVRPLGAAA